MPIERRTASPLVSLTSLVALALALVAFVRSSRGADGAPLQAHAPTTDLSGLTARVLALESRPEPRTAEAVGESRRQNALEPGAVEALAVRIATLEETVRRLESHVIVPQTSADPLTPEQEAAARREAEARRMVELASRVESARRLILDPAATETQKLESWTALRHAGENLWTDAIVDEMVRIGLGSTDESIRADVWRQADGRSHSPRIVPGLLRALAQDSSENAREEAAETLAEYRSDPSVVAALQFAAEGDASEKVRRQARASLDKH
ncbi:MAG: HEAT repeat domain-containing protein [Planctomycetota bacterium]